MTATILVSVIAFALMMGLMAIGVLLGGRRLRGSCGGNPESTNCGCSPAKKAACKVQHLSSDEHDHDIFSGPPLTAEDLAPPGERRLIQLRTGRR